MRRFFHLNPECRGRRLLRLDGLAHPRNQKQRRQAASQHKITGLRGILNAKVAQSDNDRASSPTMRTVALHYWARPALPSRDKTPASRDNPTTAPAHD